jgi:hypothetical protein
MTAAAMTRGALAPRLPERRTLTIALVTSVAAHALLTLAPLGGGGEAKHALSRAGRAAAGITAVLLPAWTDAPASDPAPVSTQPTVVTAPPLSRAPTTAPAARAAAPSPATPAVESGPERTPAAATRADRVVPGPVEGRVVIEDLGAIDAIATDAAAAAAIAPFRDSRADTPPRLPDAFLVGYPDAAFDSVAEGTQRLLVLVSVEGRVDFVVFEQEHPWFGPSIEAALRAAQFAPATRQGEPVPGWLALEFEFQIVGGGPEVAAMRERAAVRVTP